MTQIQDEMRRTGKRLIRWNQARRRSSIGRRRSLQSRVGRGLRVETLEDRRLLAILGYPGGSTGVFSAFDEASVIDSSGNVYWVGTSNGDPAPGEKVDDTYGHVVTKLDSHHNLVWVREFLPGTTAADMAVDADGNLVITGSFRDSVTLPGVSSLISNGGEDIFVARLDPNGDLLWAESFGGPEDDRGLGVAVDRQGDIYVTGRFRDTVDFNPGPGTTNLNASGTDAFLLRLERTGDFLYARDFGAGGDDEGTDVAVDHANNVFFTGHYEGLGGNDSTDGFVIALNADGQLSWDVDIRSSEDVRGLAIALDNSGDVYATGWFSGTAEIISLDSTELQTNALYTSYVVKLDRVNGELIWAADRVGGPADDQGRAIAVDEENNVYVAGDNWVGNYAVIPGGEISDSSQEPVRRAFLSKLDRDGQPVWKKNLVEPTEPFIVDDVFDCDACLGFRSPAGEISAFTVGIPDSGQVSVVGRFDLLSAGPNIPVDLDPGPGITMHVGRPFRQVFVSTFDDLEMAPGETEPGGTIGTPQYEPNNDLNDPTTLGALPSFALNDLTLPVDEDGVVDVDYFRVTAGDTGVLHVTALFPDIEGQGNIDLEILDPEGNVLTSSTNTTTDERIALPVVAQETYLLRLFSADGLPGTYDLSLATVAVAPPSLIMLNPADDSGNTNQDQVTRVAAPRLFVQADLRGMESLIAEDDGPGAVVEVTVVNTTSGVPTTVAATRVGTGSLWTATLPSTEDGQYLISASVEVRDAQGSQAVGHSLTSPPLFLTIDSTSPSLPPAPDLLAASDTGADDSDNVTSNSQPTFGGTTEPNAIVRLRTALSGPVVAQAVAGPEGNWTATLPPLSDGIYGIRVEVQDAAGNVSGLSEVTQIEIDTVAPNTPFLDLLESSDSGRHNDDQITNVNIPEFSATSEDAGVHANTGNLVFRIFDRAEDSAETLVYDSLVDLGGFTDATQIAVMLGQATALSDGIHNLKLQVEDRAGNVSHDFLLDVLIDTVAPTGDVQLRTVSGAAPQLWGAAEADALVHAWLDGIPVGTTVALPFDGDDAFPPPADFAGNYLLEILQPVGDGTHELEVRFTDVAGNESTADESSTVEFVIDTQALRITNLTFDGTRSLFEPKPSVLGPEPLTASLSIHFDELPAAAVASEEGHYQLIGDDSGNISITDVMIDSSLKTVQLVFAAPLYDDRYSLRISDSLTDAAGNRLDGESGAAAPFVGNDSPGSTAPIFPTGDGNPGGAFHARFTIDTRPEIATYLGDGTWYVDLNGNGVFDPQATDPTNRDIVWKFGSPGDIPVTGDWNGDGYDEIGVLGRRNGKDVFFLDMDRNGAFDPVVDASFEFKSQGSGNGQPIAGDWDGDGRDNVGVLKANRWQLDATGTVYSPGLSVINPTKMTTSMRGLPIAGDWDGDGDDNVGTYDQGRFSLDLDDDFHDSELTVHVSQFDVAGQAQPVAHDWDQDGDDDLGLFVSRDTTGNGGGGESGEWYLDLNTDLSVSGTVDARFEPPPTGLPGVPLVNQDIFYRFGHERNTGTFARLIPVVGNFDPPSGATQEGVADEAVAGAVYVNANNNLDVNNDGSVTPLDALVVINALAAGPIGDSLASSLLRGMYVDVNGDGYLAPRDALVVINALAEAAAAKREWDSSASTTEDAQALDVSGAVSTIAPSNLLTTLPQQHTGVDRPNSTTAASPEWDSAESFVIPDFAEADNEKSDVAAHDLVVADQAEHGLTELEGILSDLAEDLAAQRISNGELS